MAKPNYKNYDLLEDYLKRRGYMYSQYALSHYKIAGPVAQIDLWPGQMTVHVIESENAEQAGYFKLDRNFNEKQVDAVLNGLDWRTV